MKMTKFKYLSGIKEKDMKYGWFITISVALLEIAYQLKRLADKEDD